MKTFIEKIVRMRNPAFRFDTHIGTGTIISFFATQLKALLRAHSILLAGRNPKQMMMGKGVQFFNIARMQWGRFVRLGDFVYLNALGTEGITLGNHVSIGAFSRLIVATTFDHIGKGIQIGNNVGIGEFAYLGGAGGLQIGDDCIIGQYLSCHPENHVTDDLNQPIRLQGVRRKGIIIGKNCWIGSKVTILDGVTIGEGCVIAAGAVVNRSFPANSIIGGVPARLLKTRELITPQALQIA